MVEEVKVFPAAVVLPRGALADRCAAWACDHLHAAAAAALRRLLRRARPPPIRPTLLLVARLVLVDDDPAGGGRRLGASSYLHTYIYKFI